MNIVVDSSVMLSGLLPDETDPYAKNTFELMEHGVVQGLVPVLFFAEIGNGLLMSYRRQRITESHLALLWNVLSKMPLRVAGSHFLQEVSVYAQKHNLSFYDATYLHLAITQKSPLATLDKSLKNAAMCENMYFMG